MILLRHICLASCLLLAIPASGDLIYVDLPPPEGFFGSVDGSTAVKSLDLDDNGTVDVEFLSNSAFGFYVQMPTTTRITWVDGFGTLPMPAGETIGAELEPTSHPEASLYPQDPEWMNFGTTVNLSYYQENPTSWPPEATILGSWGEEDAYFALEFLGDTGTHYGWIHIEEFAGIGGWFYEYAYEDTPGTGLIAGAVPEPSSLILFSVGAIGVWTLRKRKNR